MTIKEFFEAKEQMAIHCKTRRQAEILLAKFHKSGHRWQNGDKYNARNTRWDFYRCQTCYSNRGNYGTMGFYAQFCEVIPFDNIELNPDGLDYDAGYESGYNDGYDTGFHDAIEHLKKSVEEICKKQKGETE